MATLEMTKRCHALLVLLTMIALSPLAFSEQTQETFAFDVGSIRPNNSADEESASFVEPGGRYTATNVTVRMLVKSAYSVHDNQVVGGPSWINTERFDIAGKAAGYATASGFRDHARLMLRPLLADRFKLVLRREQRDLPVYALVTVRSDGRFGSQFHRSNDSDCNGAAEAMPTVPGAAEPAILLPCGAEVYRPGHLAARNMMVSALVLNVSRWSDRIIVDRTGLEGKFDWDLQRIPEELTVNSTSTPGPSLAEALRDQAGFRLQRQRSSVDVLVIESIERPGPD